MLLLCRPSPLVASSSGWVSSAAHAAAHRRYPITLDKVVNASVLDKPGRPKLVGLWRKEARPVRAEMRKSCIRGKREQQRALVSEQPKRASPHLSVTQFRSLIESPKKPSRNSLFLRDLPTAISVDPCPIFNHITMLRVYLTAPLLVCIVMIRQINIIPFTTQNVDPTPP